MVGASLGYMCVEGWKREDYPYNPAGIKVLTREYPHQPSSVFSDIRYRQALWHCVCVCVCGDLFSVPTRILVRAAAVPRQRITWTSWATTR